VTHVEEIARALAAWPRDVVSITPMGSGWNSQTWLVQTTGGRLVAKVADRLDAEGLDSGLRTAEFAASRGLPCGAPVRTRDRRLTVPVPDGVLALLSFMPGTPPDLSLPEQLARAGRVLARAHRILRDCPVGDQPRFQWPWQWVTRCLDTIPMPAHVQEAARRTWQDVVPAVEEHDLTISLIHSDPGPEGFLLHADDPARDAIIDWSTSLRGPLLYDLASFKVITHRTAPRAIAWLIDGYLDEAPGLARQLPHLDVVVRARWVANAIYFASRIERGITRGADTSTGNEEGLATAYHGMTGAADAPTTGPLDDTATQKSDS
jgi:Ser/Thr protein kinase RdoA (MazF antagonist)